MDFTAAEIDEHYSPELEVVGSLAYALWTLNERVRDRGLLQIDLSGQRQMKADLAVYSEDNTEGVFDHRRPCGMCGR